MTDSVHTDRYRKLCELLAEARKDKGFSQEALAETPERVQKFVSKCERAERRLDVVEFLEVVAVLGLNSHSFLRQIQAVSSQ